MESDTERSAKSPHSMAVECERDVKEEPEWGECGAGEAATRADLYQGHEVKEELVIGPEILQQQDIAITMQTEAKRGVRRSRRRGRGSRGGAVHEPPQAAFGAEEEVGPGRGRGRGRGGGRGRRRAALKRTSAIAEFIVKEISGSTVGALTNKRRRSLSPIPPLPPPQPLLPSPRPPRARSLSPAEIKEEVECMPSPASSKFLELGGASTPSTSASTPVSTPHQDRPLNDGDIETAFNFGSESESDGDSDGDELVAPAIPRVFRAQMETPEDEEPTSPQQPPSLPLSPVGGAPMSPAADTPEDPVEPNNFLDFKWRSFPTPPVPSHMRREVFHDINVGPTAPHADPYEIFVRMWDMQFMEYIASETNKYAQQLAEQLLAGHNLHPTSRICDWKDTSANELYVFFAILAAMGVVSKGQVTDYWSTNGTIFVTPGFSVYMSLRRFQLICKCLHFRDNEDMRTLNLGRSEAKLFKIQPVIDHLNDIFQSSYNLQRNIALDESLLQWKGWLDINQFIPNKAAAVGIKTYEICESQTGYLWRFVVHAHKRTETAAPDPLQAFVPSLVLELLQGLENKGHTVWMDNFYNSPALARKLKTLGIDCVGTLRTNRQFVPRELTDLSKRDMRPGQVVGLTSGDVDLLVWRDRNRVATISTYHGNSTVTARGVTKPLLIHDYNIMMGGVDKKDEMLAAYPIERNRTKVWYKKLFRRLLNVSILNSYIICKHYNPTILHRSFRLSLIESLLRHHYPHVPSVPTALPQPLRANSPPTIQRHHLVEYDYNPVIKQKSRHRCVLCKKRVITFCVGCRKAACLKPCFVLMHK